MKYVIVTGGVVSGLGKGITSSSIGVLLKNAGLHVTSIKIDPYLNIDAGTMSPYEHGEVYVLEDGGEADLDLGNYERFLETRLTKDHNITTGKIYAQVLARERKGDYLGKTVQVVPHVTDAIQDWIEKVAQTPIDCTMPAYAVTEKYYMHSNEQQMNGISPMHGQVPEICMIELGGVVGDIESMVFLEAIRQLRHRVGSDNMCHVHVSYVPVVAAVGEPKSKPTQHSVRELRAAGLLPDLIICRSAAPLDRSTVGKISLFCMVPGTHVISVHDVSNIYEVPLLLHEQRVAGLVLNALRINRMPPEDLPLWRRLANKIDNPSSLVKIALVGKYTGLSDSYLSVTKSLSHAGIHAHVNVEIIWVDSQRLELAWKHRGQQPGNDNDHAKQYDEAWKNVRNAHAILVPGGFGERGIEGKILAINYARLNNIPFFGICLGFQMATIEYARNVIDLSDATSAEFDSDASTQVIIYMPEISTTQMGGTMRLGARRTVLQPNTLAAQIYGGRTEIIERHRHRYEVNPEYIDVLQSVNSGQGTGLRFSGKDDRSQRMECLELPHENHPFFFGCQYHPEFTSRPSHPNPIFFNFVLAAAKKFVREDVSLPRSRSSFLLARPTKNPSPKQGIVDNEELSSQ